MTAPRPGRRRVAAKRMRVADRERTPAEVLPLFASARSSGNGALVDDRIYATIHEAVLDHRLPPGTKLREVALAELFGVTRASIRKVLARLAHTRLVDLRPNRGAIVASPTIEESRDLFAARGAIEGAIVESLARGCTRDQVRELRALIRAEHEAYERGEPRQGLKLSIEFHRVLARMAGNAVLAEFLEQLVSRTPLVILAHQGQSADPSCSNDEHTRIVDAIASGDAPGAHAAMRTHLEGLLARLDLQQDGRREADLAEIFGVRRS